MLSFSELSMTVVSGSQHASENISNTRSYEIVSAPAAAVMQVLTNLAYECNVTLVLFNLVCSLVRVMLIARARCDMFGLRCIIDFCYFLQRRCCIVTHNICIKLSFRDLF